MREVQDQLYTDTPGGLAGNDDLGAMSSWYVWSAIGAYPETPGDRDDGARQPGVHRRRDPPRQRQHDHRVRAAGG